MMQSAIRPSKALLALPIASFGLSAILLAQQLSLVFRPTTELSSFKIITGAIHEGNPMLLGDLPAWIGAVLIIPLFAGCLIAGMALMQVIGGYKANLPQNLQNFSAGSILFLTAFIVELVLTGIASVIALWQVDVSFVHEGNLGPSGIGIFPYASLLYLVTALLLRAFVKSRSKLVQPVTA